MQALRQEQCAVFKWLQIWGVYLSYSEENQCPAPRMKFQEPGASGPRISLYSPGDEKEQLG